MILLFYLLGINLFTVFLTSHYIRKEANLKNQIVFFFTLNLILYLLANNLQNLSFLLLSIIFPWLILATIVDYYEGWIPDLSVVMIFIINLIIIIIKEKLYHISTEYGGIIYSIIFAATMIIIELILHKELIGLGDLKIFFALSLGMSFLDFSFLLFGAGCIGIIYYLLQTKEKKETKKIVFGPSIVIAFIFLIVMKKAF